MESLFRALTTFGEKVQDVFPSGIIGIFVALAIPAISLCVYLIYSMRDRVARRVEYLSQELDIMTVQLSEAEKIGHFGSFSWNFENPTASLWSEEMYNLFETPPRRRPPTVDAVIEFTHEKDREEIRTRWQEAFKRPGRFSFSFRILVPSGKLKYLRVEGTTTLSAEGKLRFIKGVMHDVTKEAEVDKAKSEFVSLASHQLKTPLTSLRWTMEGLLGGVAGVLTPDQAKHMNSVLQSSNRMIEMVNDLLNVSRIENDTLRIQPEEIDVCELAKSVYEEQRHKAEERRLNFTLNCAPGMPHMQADKSLLRMVFQNLISNAIKYTSEGGVVTCDVELGGAVKESLFVRVQDTGIGIPKADQGRVFEKLHRASNAESLVTDGTGLGLYIIKMICQKVGGDVTFESIEDKGTTFYASLPLVWKKTGKDA
ncbi:MAG: PAS domain-containing protein [Candidatus Pacebacteria bacterium]|nr:PAS domain-containing protein [Candidatus Paceibacterota bacterium]